MAPNNALPTWGNEKTMNLNTMVLTNIQSSPYFKVNLFELKTYHEVIDEIYYKVNHLEPWEKGSRKTAGQTGMCGGVRGVGAGGIVSTAYCILYKLYTLKLTRKQVNGLITHQDSPYIRGLGFMYIRYTQPPSDLWEWYEPYLEDDEELDVKAGGGHTMNIGEMLRQWLVKLEWYATLFPRIPVPIQKDIDVKLKEWQRNHAEESIPQRMSPAPRETKQHIPDEEVSFGEAARYSRAPDSHGSRDRVGARAGDRKQTPPFNIAREIEREKGGQHRRDQDARHRSRSRERKKRSSSRERHHHKSRDGRGSKTKDSRHADRDSHRGREHKRSRSRERKRSHSRDRRRSRSPHGKTSHSDDKPRDRKANRKRSRDRRRSRSRDRKRSRSRERTKHRHRESSFERDLKRERERQKQRLNENGK